MMSLMGKVEGFGRKFELLESQSRRVRLKLNPWECPGTSSFSRTCTSTGLMRILLVGMISEAIKAPDGPDKWS